MVNYLAQMAAVYSEIVFKENNPAYFNLLCLHIIRFRFYYPPAMLKTELIQLLNFKTIFHLVENYHRRPALLVRIFSPLKIA